MKFCKITEPVFCVAFKGLKSHKINSLDLVFCSFFPPPVEIIL